MRHVPDGTLRRLIDEPFAVADRDARHVEGCGRCRARSQRIAEDAATVLVLRHSGLSYAEIAGAMEVNVGQIGTMLRRAEARFRKEVDNATRS